MMWTTQALVWMLATVGVASGVVGFVVGYPVGRHDALYTWAKGKVWVEFTYPAGAVRCAEQDGGVVFLGPGRHLWFQEPNEISAGVEIRGWSKEDSAFRVLFPDNRE